MDRCAECGYVYSEHTAGSVPAEMRVSSRALAGDLLAADAERLRIRPEPDVWSALEYACHVRDVLEVQRGRLALMLREDDPSFVPMGRDERVVRDRYNEQDPARVAQQLVSAADALAADFDALGPAQWQRTCAYNYPEPARRSAVWLAQHTLHEVEHHRVDLRRVLSRKT